ncbi:L-rhamnose mutarotase [soil metagenome]
MSNHQDRPLAFRMQLKAGAAAEYERRHDELWPDLAEALRKAGIHDYSIFLDEETMSLFAVLRLRPENTKDALPLEPVMKRWWDYMADLMEVHPDNKPVEWALKPVFHFEG